MTNPARETRKLVKARLLPGILAEVEAYAAHHRRTVSAAIEDLVVLGLRAAGPIDPDPNPRWPSRRP